MEQQAATPAPRGRKRFFLGLFCFSVAAGIAFSFGIRAELERRRTRDRLVRQQEVLRVLKDIDLPPIPAEYDF